MTSQDDLMAEIGLPLANQEDEKPTLEKTYQAILKKSGNGGCGKFQWLVSAIVMCGLSGFGYIEYGLGFFELFPEFKCYINDHWEENCSTQQICGGTDKNITQYEVNYNNHTSLHNWVEQLDLVCVSKEKIGLIGSMFFAGWSCTILFVPFTADKIGRRWIFCLSMLITVATMTTMYLSHSINLTISMMFLTGMATSGRTTVGYVFANEFLTPKWQVVFGTVFNFIDGTTGLIITLYFDLNAKHYFYISVIGLVASTFSFLGTLLIMNESPLWQLKMGKVEAAKMTIRRMMRMNGVDCDSEIEALEENIALLKVNGSSKLPDSSDSIDLPAVEGTEEEQRSTMFYIRQRTIKINLVVMAYMWSAVSFTYYMIAFQLKYLPGNIYNNSLASGGSELLAIAVAGLLYGKLGMKLSFTLLFSLSVIGGICILFLGESSTFWMPFFVVLAKFGIAGGFVIVYVSTVDVFPTLFCATALGFCNFFARVLTIFAPLVAETQPPLPMLLFVILTFFGMILIQFVRPLKDQEKLSK